MNEEQRIKLMEEELKILKNEVKTILLDIREQYLNIQNPFNFNMVANTPPAGASPEQKEKKPSIPITPLDEINLAGDTALTSADTDMADAGLSFDKPFADLAEPTDIEMPGMAPAGDDLGLGLDAGPGVGFDVAPGLDLNAGAGPGLDAEPGPGLSAGPDYLDSEDEFEEEQPHKNKKLRGKKKEEAVIDDELDAEEEDNEERDILVNTRPFVMKNGKKKGSAALIKGTRSDLVVIAGLTQWVDQATGKLGKDRTEALVEMSNAMGRIPNNIKDVLIRMVRISRYESDSMQSPTATDYLATLAQLESLMSGEQIQDNALLSVLAMMKESVHG